MTIRQATLEDMTAVAQLSRELAAHVGDPDPGLDLSLLSDCGFGADRWFECLVAEQNGGIVGFALFCRRFEAHMREKRLWLGDLCVAEDWRGKDIGSALLAAVQSRAAALDCLAIDFELARDNETARKFYRRSGATPVELIELWRLPA